MKGLLFSILLVTFHWTKGIKTTASAFRERTEVNLVKQSICSGRASSIQHWPGWWLCERSTSSIRTEPCWSRSHSVRQPSSRVSLTKSIHHNRAWTQCSNSYRARETGNIVTIMLHSNSNRTQAQAHSNSACPTANVFGQATVGRSQLHLPRRTRPYRDNGK